MVGSFVGVLVSIPLLLAVVSSVDVPEQAREEIIRRGDLVEPMGGGLESMASLIGEALEVPADDSDKWYLSVITSRNCRACETLKRDFAENRTLRAWVNVGEPSKSWAHYQVFRVEDGTQRWRWEKIRIGGYPTLVVQPPRNGCYGDAKTVVLQLTGYDGDAEALSRRLSEAIQAYVRSVESDEMPRRGAIGAGLHVVDAVWLADVPTESGVEPPFEVPPRIDPREPVGPYLEVPPRRERRVSLEELRRALPDATAEFVLDHFARGSSVDDARADWRREHDRLLPSFSFMSALLHALVTLLVLFFVLVGVLCCVLVVVAVRRLWRAGSGPPAKRATRSCKGGSGRVLA